MPRVSVIVPAHDAEPYLEETLASIASQTYQDWEVVLADDGSQDGTLAVAERLAGRLKMKVLHTATAEGPATARNRAVAASNGELLALLDADDTWLPTYLERMVSAYDDSCRDGAHTGIVACNALLLGPDGLLPQTYMELIPFPRRLTLAALLRSNPIFVSALTTRAVVDNVGGFSPELFGTEDYDLWLRIVEAGYRVVAVREPQAIYRLRPASVSDNATRMACSFQLTYRRALERGGLAPRERRTARRQLRLQSVLEQLSRLRSERRSLRAGHVLRLLPLLVLVALENPGRWSTGARIVLGPRSPLSQAGRALSG